MSIIKITLPAGEIPVDGKQVSFVAPCDCASVSGLQIDESTYTVVDTMGNILTGKDAVWTTGAIVSVVLDVTNKKAYMHGSSGILPIERGGTGATTAMNARVNLGFTHGTAEPSGTPSTGEGSVYFMEDDGSPLPISEGGTGANTKMGAKQNFLIGATAVPSFSTKSLVDSEVTLIPLANFDVKTDSEFQIGGSGGIVMPYSGTVLVSGGLYIVTDTSTAASGVFIQIIRNGASIGVCSNYSLSRGGMTAGTKLINVEAGDILCIYGRGYGSAATVYATTVKDSFLSVFYV